ncbi:GDSL-type esterase/lipase family protein [Sporosarcina ureilytica]|uniref:GDSL family lipase n=1 Tax=Sporosarcina ureilytica TaxID=298596 RepID=A0A1D8JG55_9BACL|nr:GDSL-type esterase/lipase family protein [Sporosarcina ureilytica]AOV07690.1 GDSL family lipase [Sporosarcina ureilytica]
MRKLLIMIVFSSLLLSGCHPGIFKNLPPVKERPYTAFEKWVIPGVFIQKSIYVIGLGDSLTEGIGDELKMGGYFGRVTTAMAEWQGVKDVEANNLAKRGRRSDQLITQLEGRDVQEQLKKADIILFTIGGNDVMKIVKRDLFELKINAFNEELSRFEKRLDEIFGIIRGLNGNAIIIVGGLYNPFSIVADEATEFDEILEDWNDAIEVRTVLDGKSCFIPVSDLFYSNENMVYHTDFFHPNAKGYVQMANRYIESIDKCNLFKLSDGNFDM